MFKQPKTAQCELKSHLIYNNTQIKNSFWILAVLESGETSTNFPQRIFRISKKEQNTVLIIKMIGLSLFFIEF